MRRGRVPTTLHCVRDGRLGIAYLVAMLSGASFFRDPPAVGPVTYGGSETGRR
ncbi:hypothetical protein [Micromonospora sp. CA-244673]|uniref:hypothetical protein n=1 Tax=Micromonospora sp. CA-244673 TaxID=3239958 RepID=UPI003D8B9213